MVKGFIYAEISVWSMHRAPCAHAEHRDRSRDLDITAHKVTTLNVVPFCCCEPTGVMLQLMTRLNLTQLRRQGERLLNGRLVACICFPTIRQPPLFICASTGTMDSVV